MTHQRLGTTDRLNISGFEAIGAGGSVVAYVTTAAEADLFCVAPALEAALIAIRDHGSKKECRGYPASVCLEHVKKIAADALLVRPGDE